MASGVAVALLSLRLCSAWHHVPIRRRRHARVQASAFGQRPCGPSSAEQEASLLRAMRTGHVYSVLTLAADFDMRPGGEFLVHSADGARKRKRLWRHGNWAWVTGLYVRGTCAPSKTSDGLSRWQQAAGVDAYPPLAQSVCVHVHEGPPAQRDVWCQHRPSCRPHGA